MTPLVNSRPGRQATTCPRPAGDLLAIGAAFAMVTAALIFRLWATYPG